MSIREQTTKLSVRPLEAWKTVIAENTLLGKSLTKISAVCIRDFFDNSFSETGGDLLCCARLTTCDTLNQQNKVILLQSAPEHTCSKTDP